MGDGVQLTRSMLNALLAKEKSVALTANIYQKFSVKNSSSLSLSTGDVSVNGQTSNEDEFATTPTQRDEEVKWIISMGRQFEIGIKTLGLAVAVFDRVLCVSKVRKKYLKCMAVTSLYLAVKFHEEIEDEENSSNPYCVYKEIRERYSVEELNRMERSILAVLRWDLLLPSIDRWIEAMLIVIGAPHLLTSPTLRHNLEQVISNWSLVSVNRPSTLALALLSLMLEITSPHWARITASLMNLFKVEDEALEASRRKVGEIIGGKENSSENHYKRLRKMMPPVEASKGGRKRSIFEVLTSNEIQQGKNQSERPPSNGKMIHNIYQSIGVR